MHKFVLKMFEYLRDFLHFLKIVCIFSIIMLLFYWIQNVTNTTWQWTEFFTPFLKGLLDFSNNLCSLDFNLFGAVFELKYISAIALLFCTCFVLHICITLSKVLEGIYVSTHFLYKKTEEAMMNRNFAKKIEQEEKRIQKYFVCIQTRKKSRFRNLFEHVSVQQENTKMNNFIFERLNVKPEIMDGKFLYSFANFDKVDDVLHVLFKILESKAPLDYAMCIQVGLFNKENSYQIKTLATLECFGKIIMAADSAYRYKFNKNCRYETSSVGIFQCKTGTIEVHEFVNKQNQIKQITKEKESNI